MPKFGFNVDAPLASTPAPAVTVGRLGASNLFLPRWSARQRYREVTGCKRKPRKPAILRDLDRIRSPPFEGTLKAGAARVQDISQDVINNYENGKTDPQLFVGKFGVGFASIPCMAEMYGKR